MEEEARHILCQAVSHAPAPADLGESIHRRFAALGGVDLDLPPRAAMPDAPRFDQLPMIVIDTNVMSELMRAAPSQAVLDRFGHRDAGDLCIGEVTEAELRRGVATRRSAAVAH